MNKEVVKMLILKILSIMILLFGILWTVCNLILIIKKKKHYNFLYIIIVFLHSIIPLLYIILN